MRLSVPLSLLFLIGFLSSWFGSRRFSTGYLGNFGYGNYTTKPLNEWLEVPQLGFNCQCHRDFGYRHTYLVLLTPREG